MKAATHGSCGNVVNEEWERGAKGPDRRENVLNEEWEWGTGAPTGTKMC